MGVVYSAYDDELDRKVALKLVAIDRLGPATVARVRREAQALARLSHPNVVHVYEVGEAEGHAFVAMEFVAGQTLRAYQEAPERSAEELLGAYAQAGRGLAAAHAAGLIHRDFKPDNALLGEDGRVRVVDFGLARPYVRDDDALDVDETAVSATESGRGAPSSGEVELALTRTGTLIGTPRYMSPEQLCREPADARSDVFSFALVLYEALYHRRPFPADDIRGIILRVCAGEPEAAPRDSGVPAWLHRLVLRGLATAPADRFASMDALLAALTRDRARARRRRALGSVGGLALAAAVVGWGVREPPVEACAGADAAVVGIWGEARHDALKAAFTATGAPYADAAARRARAGLDDYTERWAAARREACEAHGGGLTSDSAYDRQSACFDRRLASVEALIGVLAGGDAETLARADGLVASLPELEPCADVEALARSHLELPEDPAQAIKVVAIRDSLERVRTLDLAGLYTTAANDAMVLLSAAEASGFPPVIAEVRYWHGVLQGRVGDLELAEATLLATLATSVELDHEALAAATAVALVEVIDESGRYAEALRWAQLAESLLRRVDAGAERQAAALVTIATVELHAGEYDAATERLERALSLRVEASGAEDPDVVPIYAALAKVHQERHEPARAEPLLERALAILEGSFGPEHPRCAELLDKLGAVLGMQGRYAEAELHLRRALDIRERALGRDHLLVGEILNNLGLVLSNQEGPEKRAEAEAIFTRALGVIEASVGPGHPSLAYPLNSLGVLYLEEERCADAVPLLERALEINRRTLDREHKALAYPVLNIAACNATLERHAEAVKGYREGLALLTRVTGENHGNVARIHRDLGEELVALGRYEDAADELRRSLEIFDALAEPRFADDRAEALFLSAVALRGERPRDPEARREARRRAREAREAVSVEHPVREAIEAWLRER
jgi:tetratricopeptide (TPR) repeat protein